MEDFKSNKIKLISKYHTKNMMSYDWEFKGITFSAKYFLPIERFIMPFINMLTPLDKIAYS